MVPVAKAKSGWEGVVLGIQDQSQCMGMGEGWPQIQSCGEGALPGPWSLIPALKAGRGHFQAPGPIPGAQGLIPMNQSHITCLAHGTNRLITTAVG